MAVRPNYGIDAPGTVRWLTIAGTLGAAMALSGAYVFAASLLGSTFAWLGGLLAASFLGTAMWMVWSSRIGKFRLRDRLLAAVQLRGDERVLDVGCGRGLALIGAAKQLKTGTAVGVDLWSTVDLSGNTPTATLANAALEGVTVAVETGDMRKLPFPSGGFDVVLSMTAIHNISDRDGRDQALREIVRVLKPGGRLAIFDIFHLFRYGRVLRQLGMLRVRGSGLILLWFVPGRCFFARKPA